MITKRAYIVFTIILSLLSVAAGVILVQKKQYISKKAGSFCVKCNTSNPGLCNLGSVDPAIDAMQGRWCTSDTCTWFDACAPHVQPGQSCTGKYTDVNAYLKKLSNGEADRGMFVGCSSENQSDNCFCNGFTSGYTVSCYHDTNEDSCAARESVPPTSTPVPTNTPIPTSTPTPISTTTPIPYNINWIINSHVSCPDGTQLTGKTRNFYAYWPSDPLTWQYNSFSLGDKTISLSMSSNSTSNIYFGMETETEVALDMKGTVPSSQMTYAKYFNPPTSMIQWNKRLPAGTYDITFLGNTEVCTAINTPTPTKTPTPTSTSVPTNTPTPTLTPTGTLSPTETPKNTPTPTKTPTPNPSSTPTPNPSSTPTGTPHPSSTPTTTPSPTSTSRPSAPTATPTVVVLPQSGIEFPTQGLTIVGIIVTLIGFLVLL